MEVSAAVRHICMSLGFKRLNLLKIQQITKLIDIINFIVTPCINSTEHFYYQLMHITLKNVELLKHSKLEKNAPTCFGLHRNHLPGAKVSAWLKITRLVDSICVKDVQGTSFTPLPCCDCGFESRIKWKSQGLKPL